MSNLDAVTLTRAQVEELRAIIHNADSPLGNRLQDVSARLYFALDGAGWTPTIKPHPSAAANREPAGAVDPSGVRRFLEKLVSDNRKSGAMFPQIAKEIDADDEAHQRILKLIDFYHPSKAAAPEAAAIRASGGMGTSDE
jgi:hypothetical protein